MIKCIKMFAFLFATMFFVSSVSAKIIHLNDLREYEFMGSSSIPSGGDVGCPSNYLENEPSNKDCQKDITSGCFYDCKCKSNYKYKANECKEPNFVSSGGSCTDSDGTRYYEGCSCASGLISDTSGYTTYFNVGNGESVTGKDGAELTCYDPKNFTCKDNSSNIPSEFVDHDKSIILNSTEIITSVKDEPIRYYAITNLPYGLNKDNNNLKICANGIILVFPDYKDAVNLSESILTTKARCASVASATAKYVNGKTYYYYNGSRNDIDECPDSTQTNDCRETASESVTYYIPETNSIDTRSYTYVPGTCRTGIIKDENTDTKYLCDSTRRNTSENISLINNDPCVKIGGCLNGYEEHEISDDVTTFDSTIRSIDRSEFQISYSDTPSGYRICKKRKGCPRGFDEHINTRIDLSDCKNEYDRIDDNIYEKQKYYNNHDGNCLICTRQFACPYTGSEIICDYEAADPKWKPFIYDLGLNASDSIARCNDLGYSCTESDCEGYATLKCPFDYSKLYCAKPCSATN